MAGPGGLEGQPSEETRMLKYEKMFMTKLEEQRQVEVRNVVSSAMVPIKPVEHQEDFKVQINIREALHAKRRFKFLV